MYRPGSPTHSRHDTASAHHSWKEENVTRSTRFRYGGMEPAALSRRPQPRPRDW